MTEIAIVNSIGACLMLFLLLTRIENKDKKMAGDRIFDIMIWVTFLGCLIESLTFVVDGENFPACRAVSYILNSLCFIGTCSVGFMWCIFVDYKIYNSVKRIRRKSRYLIIPLLVDVVLNFINLSGCGLIFSVSRDNVYSRGSLVILVYVSLFMYFIYSIYIVATAKENRLHIRFMPIYYFVVPCMIGTLVQGLMYGITIGWTAVAVSLLFVYIQSQSQKVFVDSLSELYNRKYMDYVLSSIKNDGKSSIHGIMLDVNDFKHINDAYGHAKGDDAIRTIGRMLSDVVPDNGLVVRFAGDEFIILINTDDDRQVDDVIAELERKTEQFNSSMQEPYSIRFAIGCGRLDMTSGGVEAFISDMDRAMYISKRRYYQREGIDRRRQRTDA